MIPRVHAPGLPPAGGIVEVGADEAAHLVRVLRLGRGAVVRVFDGAGREWDGVIDTASKTAVRIAVTTRVTPAPEPRIRYSVALAVLKGDASDEAIRDAVMLGVSAVRPFVSIRAETTLPALSRGHRRERWVRVAVASARQCGRATVPVVHEAVTFARLLRDVEDGCRLLLVEPGLSGPCQVPADLPPPSAVTLAAGPEGGWTPEEVEAAEAAGWLRLRLGGRVLRAVTAPAIALAACQAVWRET